MGNYVSKHVEFVYLYAHRSWDPKTEDPQSVRDQIELKKDTKDIALKKKEALLSLVYQGS